MYRLLGYVLIELGRTEEAKIALEKGMKWNPMNLDTKFEYYETFKMSDKDRYLELSKEAMKIAYLKKDIARIYRNIGFILIEKKNYEAACYTYMLSNMCESNEKNASELYYIQQVSGKDYTSVAPERLITCLNENKIPFRPNEKLIDSLCQIAIALEDKKVFPDALKAYTLLSDLTDDKSIENKVKELTAIVEKTK